jgi:predicted metal-dependent HD superfamily phosphohydrolase
VWCRDRWGTGIKGRAMTSRAPSEPSVRNTLPTMLLDRLAAKYAEPHRHYHSTAHVHALLRHLERYRVLAKEPALITAAIWYHDAVYDTRRDDNEERSAALAQSELASIAWPESAIRRVAEMVRATRSHQADPGDSDMLLFLDLDLSILGTRPEAYADYCSAVRAEYQWVPEADYVKGRSRVLQAFLARESIYRTPELIAAWESSAQLNLRRELDALSTLAPRAP